MTTHDPLSTCSEDDQQALLEAALDARQHAYAPYSEYRVGAAVLADNGIIYTGCNIENASYGATMCAERVAVFRAISDGARVLVALAVVTRDGGAPCGMCRQVLSEFGPDMDIITADDKGQVSGVYTLSALLPVAFGRHNIRDVNRQDHSPKRPRKKD